jgi:hypothetical protein
MKPSLRRVAVLVFSFGWFIAWLPRPTSGQHVNQPTPEEAKKFIEQAEQEISELTAKASRADWVGVNFITQDTEAIAADADEALNTAATNYAKQAHRYDKVALSPELARKRLLLEQATEFPAPDDVKSQKELATILASLSADYGKGKWCPDGEGKPCLDITKIERLMATSRDPEQLKRAWVACGGRADAKALRAHGGTGQRWVATIGLRGCGRVVALEVRYAAGRVCQGIRSRVGTVAAAVSLAARLRARATGEEIRRERGASRRADTGAPVGESVGAGVEQRLRPYGFTEAAAEL